MPSNIEIHKIEHEQLGWTVSGELNYDTFFDVVSGIIENTDHGNLDGLTDDDHTQYPLLAGRAGGQTLLGGTASGDDLTLNSTSNATKGDVLIQTAGGNVGIGTASPSALLDIVNGTTQLTLEAASLDLKTNSSSTFNMYRASADANAGGFVGYKSRGTLASPTVPSADDKLLTIGAGGWDGNTWESNKAVMFYQAKNQWSAIDNSTYLTFFTTPAASQTRAERVRIDSTGYVGIGTTTPGLVTTAGRTYLTIKGTTLCGTLELATAQADAAAVGVGLVQFTDVNSTAADKRIGAIDCTLAGATANNRGGQINLYTKPNGSSGLTSRMTIDNVGNVGIGGAPSYKLHTYMNADSAQTIAIENASAGASAYTGLRFKNATDDNAQISRIGSGNSAYAGANSLMMYQNGNYPLGFVVNNTLQATINATGLGIGKVPAYQLELSLNSAAKPTSTAWTVPSDKRLKEDIEIADYDICLQNIKNLDLKRWKWTDSFVVESKTSDLHRLGFIADEVEVLFNKSITINKNYGVENLKSIDVDQIQMSAYGALKKVISIVEEISERLVTAEKNVSDLTQENKDLREKADTNQQRLEELLNTQQNQIDTLIKEIQLLKNGNTKK